MRTAAIAATALILSACAADRGWSGSGAEPFDQALADCQSRTTAMGGKDERRFAIDTCMASKGWTRPRR